MKDRIIEIGRDSAWYLLAQIAYALIAFVALMLFTRIFNPHDYGIFSLVNTAIIMISTVFYGWLMTAVIRFYPEYVIKDELDLFYSTSLHYVPHFMAFFLLLLLPLAAFVIPLGQYRVLVCLAIVVLALYSLFSVLGGAMRARQMAWQYSVFVTIMQVCRFLLGAGLAVWFRAGVAGPFWGWMGALIVLIPLELIVLAIWKNLSWKKNSPRLQREMLKFGYALIFSSIFLEILSTADRYMLQAFKDAYQVGLYSVVYTLVQSIEQLIVSFLTLAAFPVIMKVYENEGEENTKKLIKSITRYFLIFLVPVVFGIWVIRTPVVSVITTPKYLPAQSAFLPLLIGIFWGNLAWLPLLAFFVKKNTKMILIPLIAATITNVGLNFILIPKYGFLGAAWATFAAYLLYFLIAIFMAPRHFRWEFPWIGLVKVLLATGAMMGALYALLRMHPHGWQGLLLLIVAAIITYFAAFLAIKGFSKPEIAFALDLGERLPVAGAFIKRMRTKQ